MVNDELIYLYFVRDSLRVEWESVSAVSMFVRVVVRRY